MRRHLHSLVPAGSEARPDGTRIFVIMTPESNGFVLGDRAVDAALRSDLPDSLKQQLRDARRYVEGRGVRLTVLSEQDLGAAQALLDIRQSH